MEVMGPFPETNPVKCKDHPYHWTKVIIKSEHIIFESQPGFYVTSTLFLPKSIKGNDKAPVILYCSGHAE